MSAPEESNLSDESKVKTMAQEVIVWLLISLAFLYSIIAILLIFASSAEDSRFYTMHKALIVNANATIGIPAAALCAFFLVWAFPYISNDKISSFKAIGIEFKGVASQVVLWVFVFLSIVGSIELLGE